ncbi:hypothetical protein MEZE111188_12315 [Mesobacillus zeae]
MQAIVLGFAGIRNAVQSPTLELHPKMPAFAEEISFSIIWKGSPVGILLKQNSVSVQNKGNLQLSLSIFDQILQSIPRIGEKIEAMIISEIGEIDRFNDAKKLVAFAGVDPSVYSSSKFTASINRITKRGSFRLRHALYMAVQSGIWDARKKKTTDEIIPRNKELREFYEKNEKKENPSE